SYVCDQHRGVVLPPTVLREQSLTGALRREVVDLAEREARRQPVAEQRDPRARAEGPTKATDLSDGATEDARREHERDPRAAAADLHVADATAGELVSVHHAHRGRRAATATHGLVEKTHDGLDAVGQVHLLQ